MTERTDAERFAFIADKSDALVTNKWLVQGIVDGKWHTAYYAAPSKEVIPPIMYGSRLEAVRVVVDAMMDTVTK